MLKVRMIAQGGALGDPGLAEASAGVSFNAWSMRPAEEDLGAAGKPKLKRANPRIRI